MRYGFGMPTQITIRLPDEAAAHLDREVSSGRASSRAELIAYLLAKDVQRQQAIADLERLREAGALPHVHPDLDGVARVSSRRPPDLD